MLFRYLLSFCVIAIFSVTANPIIPEKDLEFTPGLDSNDDVTPAPEVEDVKPTTEASSEEDSSEDIGFGFDLDSSEIDLGFNDPDLEIDSKEFDLGFDDADLEIDSKEFDLSFNDPDLEIDDSDFDSDVGTDKDFGWLDIVTDTDSSEENDTIKPNVPTVEDDGESIAVRQAGFMKELVQGIIKAGITGASINCVNQAANNCQDHWQDKIKTLKCAKDFLSANQGKCAFGIKS